MALTEGEATEMTSHEVNYVSPLAARVTADVPVGSPQVLVAGCGDSAALLTEELAREGCAVTRVHDGWAALDHLRNCSADVALLYQTLPGLDGVDVCRLIKREQRTRLLPKLLLLSDSESGERCLTGIESAVDGLIAMPVDVCEVTARARSLVRMKRHREDFELAASVMMTLATMIEARDRYSGGHCHRTANYAATLGRRIGLSGEELEDLRRGGFLHDIGMLTVPDAVLLKPASLDPDEVALIRSHTVIGESLISNLPSLQPVRTIVRHHHERRDGSGYPEGLRGDEISLSAQIVGLVDIFDALTSPRPYQKAVSSREALEVLRGQVKRGWHRQDLFDELADIVRAA